MKTTIQGLAGKAVFRPFKIGTSSNPAWKELPLNLTKDILDTSQDYEIVIH